MSTIVSVNQTEKKPQAAVCSKGHHHRFSGLTHAEKLKRPGKVLPQRCQIATLLVFKLVKYPKDLVYQHFLALSTQYCFKDFKKEPPPTAEELLRWRIL